MAYNPNSSSPIPSIFHDWNMEDRYTIELIKLGEKIRHLRKLKNLTQLDLALQSGIDNGDISRIENGRTNIELLTVVKLAEALEVELKDLFTD